MLIYCTGRFQSEYKRLVKHNAYKILESEIIGNFFNCPDEQICHGVTIIGNSERKVVKKRLAGRGGFRVYFYAYISSNKLYLSYIYPKTGPEGKVSLNAKFERLIISETVEAIQNNELFKVTVLNGRLNFGDNP